MDSDPNAQRFDVTDIINHPNYDDESVSIVYVIDLYMPIFKCPQF